MRLLKVVVGMIIQLRDPTWRFADYLVTKIENGSEVYFSRTTADSVTYKHVALSMFKTYFDGFNHYYIKIIMPPEPPKEIKSRLELIND